MHLLKREMKYSYFAYGLTIHSTLSLPELVPYEGIADVVIRLDKLDLLSSKVAFKGSDFCVTSDGVLLFWENEGKFLIRDGHEIIVDPAPGVDERVLRLIILGPALALLLHQRGLLALHAATVEINGSAVVLMGSAGCGKSALAATIYKRGHGIVADDITAIHLNGEDNLVVFPGFPQLKLWPEVVVSLGDDPEKLPRIESRIEKRARCITRRFSETPLLLRRIYVLEEGQTEEIIPLRPQEALVELLRHSYRALLVRWIGAEQHLFKCATLINNIPICYLKRPLCLSALPEIAQIVEKDLAYG